MSRTRRCAYALLIATAVAVVGTGGWFWHQGYRVYVLRTGSMTPTYPTGSVVLDRPGRGHYAVGQVITFDRVELGEKVVTHRIVKIRPDGSITTKGDANRTPDVWTVTPHQVRGSVVFGVKDLGYALVFLRQPTGVAALALSIASMAMLWGLFFPAEPVAERVSAPVSEPAPAESRRTRKRVPRHAVIS